jgi:hypothetical protein
VRLRSPRRLGDAPDEVRCQRRLRISDGTPPVS